VDHSYVIIDGQQHLVAVTAHIATARKRLKERAGRHIVRLSASGATFELRDFAGHTFRIHGEEVN